MLGRNWDGETVSMQTEEQADLIEFVANGGKEDE